MSQEAINILKNSRLSITENRIKILTFFLQAKKALSHSEIENKFNDQLDRATIYRTLSSFMEKGVIHSIPTDDYFTLYALCKNECTENHHHDEHIHFVCDVCKKTNCLDKVIVPTVLLPKGYKAKEVKMIIKGQCNECI